MAGKGKYSAEIERLQREAQSDGFPISVDGIDGPETKAALEKYREAKAERQRQDAERNRADANAKQAASQAEAKRAEAEAERVRAETERARIEGENKRRSDEAEEAARVRDAAAAKATKDAVMTTVAIAAGIGLGHVSAAGIAAKDKKAVSARNRELAKVGNQAEAALDTLAKSKVSKGAAKSATSRVEGAVAAADKLDPKGIKGAARLAGRVGALRGVSFIAEGLALRTIVSDKVADENTKQILQEVGTGLMLAGSGTIAESATNVATAAPVSGKAAGQIEAARSFKNATAGGATAKEAAKLATAAKGAAAAEVSLVNAAAKVMKKVVPGVALVAAVAALVSNAKAEGVKGVVDAIDPTNTGSGGVLNKVFSGKPAAEPPVEDPNSIQALARKQAAEREAKRTGVMPLATAQPQSSGPSPNVGVDEANVPTVSSVAVGAMERGNIDPRQAALVAAVGVQGLDKFYAGYRPAEFLAREPHQEVAARSQRESAERLSQEDVSQRYSDSVVVTSSTGAPRGFQIKEVREAALEARRAKRGY